MVLLHLTHTHCHAEYHFVDNVRSLLLLPGQLCAQMTRLSKVTISCPCALCFAVGQAAHVPWIPSGGTCPACLHNVHFWVC